MSGGQQPSYTQNSFRIRTGDTVGLNVDSGWEALENIDATIDAGRRFRIRFHFEETVGKGNNQGFQLQALHPNGSNSWEILVIDSSPTGTLAPAIPRLSNEFTDGDAATELLTNQGGTYEDGDGDALDNSAQASPDATETECEWCILIPRYYYVGATRYLIDDSDTIQFRVVESDDTAFDTYSETPTITVNHPDRWLGGTYGETVLGVGPHIDSNGNQYQLQEYNEILPELVMMKSTDGGITWSPVDEANLPAETDWEGACSVATDTHIHILHHAGSDVVYHQFAMSAAASNPDTWRTTDETIETGISAALQVGSLVARSTEIVAFYQMNDGAENVFYKKRDSLGDTGTWDSSGTEIDPAPVDFYAPNAVKEIGSDIVHIFYKDQTNGAVYHKSLNESDTLSGRELVEGDAGTATSRLVSMTNAVAWQDGSDEYVMVAVHDATDDFLYSVTIKNDGSPGARREAAGEDVEHDNSGSRAPQATLCVNGKDIHLLFAQDVGGNIYATKSVNDAAWDVPTGLETGQEYKCNNISARVHTHNGGNGGATVVAYTWDNNIGDGGWTGDIWYNEFEVTASAVPIFKSVDETLNVDEVINKAAVYVRLIAESVNLSEVIDTYRDLIRTITTELVNISEAVLSPRVLLRIIDNVVSIPEDILEIVSTAITKIIDEVVSIPENIVRSIGFLKTVSETVSLPEVASAARVLIRTITTEVLNINETILNPRVLLRTISNTVNIPEDPLYLRGLLRIVDEAINISETALKTLARLLVKTINEVVDIPEVIVSLRGRIRAVAEAVNINEDITAARKLIRDISDAVNTNEIVIATRDLIRTLSETVSIDESIDFLKNIVRAVSEAVSIPEVVLRSRIMLRTLAETVSIPEPIFKALGYVKTISEVVNIQEFALRVLATVGVLVKVINEDVSISELIQTARDLVALITESVNIPEAVSANRILLRIVDEVVQISETIYRSKVILWIISETSQVIESIQRRGTWRRIVSETVNVVESISRLGVIVKTIIETVNISETITHLVAEFLAAIDKSKFKSMFKGAFKRMQ